MINCGLVEQAVAGYDQGAQESNLVEAERQRTDFLERFPPEAWATMSLDRYALGQSDKPETFCRWLEFVTTELGSIRGGSARKHLIYYQAANKRWWFDAAKYTDVDEAWLAVRQGFRDAIAAAGSGDWNRVTEITALKSGSAVINKTLSIYFPDQLLPINSQTHLRHFLRELGDDDGAGDQSLGATTLNRRLLEGLRACAAVASWSTKQLERLLYTTGFDPFETQPGKAIPDPAGFVARVLAEIGSDRQEHRRATEDQARKLLDDNAGTLTAESLRELLALFNADHKNGKVNNARFSPAFVGQTANTLVDRLAEVNEWTARVWNGDRAQADGATGELLSDRTLVKGAGTSFPSMLMYLRDPESCAVWLSPTDQGLQRLTAYKPARSPSSGGPDDYATFCRFAATLMSDFGIPPELLDVVLVTAARAGEEVVTPPVASDAGIWVFQANPEIYDIDHALSESNKIDWVVRQHASDVRPGDRVYLWRSGAEAGVIATATVLTEPQERAGDPNDPFLLKKETLTKPEPRVDLKVDRTLPLPVRRTDLLNHSVLKTLGVITLPNQTNYRVTSEQDAALRALVDGVRLPSLRADLEERVHLPIQWLQDAVELLREKGQVIFYGPPGTGKTYVAKALAAELTREGGQSRIVQFHPSYGYEDFVGGFRPVEDDGAHGVAYRRSDGALRQIAADARKNPSTPHILVIDEINRGNIPKIFGELLFLLEYRDESVALQYWPEQQFSLPRNLFVIGTMNTADRSIALVDAALRRRFYFVPFTPTEWPVKDVLSKWLARHQHDDQAARILAALNSKIASDELAIGPSYFMTNPDDAPNLERIWERAIMPLLEEYFYASPDKLKDFALATFLNPIDSKSEDSSPAETTP